MEPMEIDGGKAPSEDTVLEGEEVIARKLVVILIGLPGSGKSTFCDEVMRISARSWVRVCQDTIGKGKSGTKNQCLSVAVNALSEGKSVLIDRCNIDRVQRAEFLTLGAIETEKHAVVLDLPVKICASRSVARTQHEGNLQGGKAAAVVNRIAQNKELPKLSEGFHRITVCQNENDVKQAIKTYGLLGIKDSLPYGSFGQENKHNKAQLGIMKFFKKVDTFVDSENIPTLAFPSISTADFQFDIDKASDIIVEKVAEFENRVVNARLILVDISHESKILSLVKEKASRKNIDPSKFFTFVEDITRLHSRGGLQCDVIANAANWRLSRGGGGVNAAIFNAAGSEFEVATKERVKCLSRGESLIVPLSASSPLFSREGITHVIHVLGPNMNPMRPDCLNGDYVEGCKVLQKAYSSLFEGFISILHSEKSVKLVASQNQTTKRKAPCDFDRSIKGKGHDNVNNIENEQAHPTKIWGLWSLALYEIAMNPEKNRNVVLELSDDYLVMNDAFPKAKYHLLILARSNGLDCIRDVNRDHLSLLREFHNVGLKWIKKYIEEDRSLSFRMGYHLSPSMRQLHLHVISQDFNSSRLKNKKHWNSFNTRFFLDSIDVIKQVDEGGNVVFEEDFEKFLKKELRCNRCESVHPTIPHLKSHLTTCKAPLLQNVRLVSAESF